ncbi:UNVERIFIED_CONTAM: hypothetical protein FKN15_069527 [Acipenser sinensis]
MIVALCQGRVDDAPEKVAHAGSHLHGLPHPPLPPSYSEQVEKLWAAVSHQGTVLAELLHERSLPPVLLGSQGAMSTDWQQNDALSLAASEEVGKQELAFPSEDVKQHIPCVKALPCWQSFYH